MGCTAGKSRSMDVTPVDTQPSPPGRVLVSDREGYYRQHPGVFNSAGTRIPEPASVPTPNGARTEDERRVLKVVGVELKIAENCEVHHTGVYECASKQRRQQDEQQPINSESLVVRRGEHVQLDITFDRPFDDVRDDVKLIFEIESGGREGTGTRAVVDLQSPDDKPRQWSVKVIRQSGETVTAQVYLPPSLPVGRWMLKVDTVVKKAENAVKVFRYVHADPMYIIFNPWCPGDHVFLSDDICRTEYVLNDTGFIVQGTAQQPTRKPWNFGQFDSCVLDASLYLLDISGLSWRLRGDARLVVRSIASMINSADDQGLLIGNWSGDYTGGVAPSTWTGSVAIIDEFWRTRKPVRFGQCWVAAAVFATVCRALGIPARCLTSFTAPFDTDGSGTVDLYWNHDGSPLSSYNVDSLWCFHVWNDVWIARPDLPSGFSGWQSVDCTPQMAVSGMRNVGPTAAEAVKSGLVSLSYDGPFVFAQLNADLVNWIQQPDGNWVHTVLRNFTSKKISTKGCEGADVKDITNLYKFTSGTVQYSTAMARASMEHFSSKHLHLVDATEMTFELQSSERTTFGEPFDVRLRIHSTATCERNVTVTTAVTSVQYTGLPLNNVRQQQTNVRIRSCSCIETKCNIEYTDYQDAMNELSYVRIYVMCFIHETSQYYCQILDVQLVKPALTIKIPESIPQGQEFDLEASFSNPLSRPLTRCQFQVEAARFQLPVTYKHETVAPHAECKLTVRLPTTQAGLKRLIVSFHSKELSDVTGTAELNVA